MNVFFYDNKTKALIDNVWADNGATATRTWYGLVRGQTYGFFVRARDSAGLWGDNATQSFKVNKLPIADNLKTENRVNPDNLTTFTPRLGWKYSDNDTDNQKKYRVQVGTYENGNDMWDFENDLSKDNFVTYNYNGTGTPLSAGTIYYWRVMVCDNYNEWSADWKWGATFVINTKPNKPTNLLPSARQTTTDVTISAVVTDNNGNSMNVFFYDNKTKALIGSVWADNGTTASVVWTGRVRGQTYGFFARAQDSAGLWGDNSVLQSFRVNMSPIAENLKAENRVNPDNLTTPTPLLSWNYFDNDKDNQRQRQIQVGTSADGNNMWDSTVPTSATAATYAGAPLTVGQTYYWRVRVFDNYEWSDWKSGATFKRLS
jgi:hypothetical protein